MVCSCGVELIERVFGTEEEDGGEVCCLRKMLLVLKMLEIVEVVA